MSIPPAFLPAAAEGSSEDGYDDVTDCFSCEQLAAGQHFIENDTKTEDISPDINSSSPGLLRRHNDSPHYQLPASVNACFLVSGFAIQW